jgi:hypothetical protein
LSKGAHVVLWLTGHLTPEPAQAAQNWTFVLYRDKMLVSAIARYRSCSFTFIMKMPAWFQIQSYASSKSRWQAITTTHMWYILWGSFNSA